MRKLAIAAALTIGAATLPAAAQDYPTKAVKIIVPYEAGGATDILARAVADRFSTSMKQPFVVENRPGAGATLGTTIAARARGDGYTLYLGQVSSHGIAPNLYPSLQYDPVKDFTPIGLIASIPNVMVVNAKTPVSSVAEFVALAKQKRGKITFASSGNGSSIHLSGEMFKSMAGIDINHIPFKGSAPAVTALVAGQVDVMFDNMPSAMPHIEAGTLRALAVTTAKRSPSLPDVPTLDEVGRDVGLAEFEATSWFGLLAPANTPKPIVAKLNAALNAVLKDRAFIEFLSQRGAVPEPGTPEDFDRFIKSELAKWRQVIEAAGVKLE